MEIVELISFYINNLSNTLDVVFRMNGDDENDTREDKINLYDAEDFGYEFINKLNDNLYDENFYYHDDIDDEEYTIDENEIINFLDDYYSLFPEKIPNIEL